MPSMRGTTRTCPTEQTTKSTSKTSNENTTSSASCAHRMCPCRTSTGLIAITHSPKRWKDLETKRRAEQDFHGRQLGETHVVNNGRFRLALACLFNMCFALIKSNHDQSTGPPPQSFLCRDVLSDLVNPNASFLEMALKFWMSTSCPNGRLLSLSSENTFPEDTRNIFSTMQPQKVSMGISSTKMTS